MKSTASRKYVSYVKERNEMLKILKCKSHTSYIHIRFFADFTINVTQKTHWMPWMDDYWMVGNFESKWHDMDVQRLRIAVVEVVVVGGGFSLLSF